LEEILKSVDFSPSSALPNPKYLRQQLEDVVSLATKETQRCAKARTQTFIAPAENEVEGDTPTPAFYAKSMVVGADTAVPPVSNAQPRTRRLNVQRKGLPCSNLGAVLTVLQESRGELMSAVEILDIFIERGRIRYGTRKGCNSRDAKDPSLLFVLGQQGDRKRALRNVRSVLHEVFQRKGVDTFAIGSGRRFRCQIVGNVKLYNFDTRAG